VCVCGGSGCEWHDEKAELSVESDFGWSFEVVRGSVSFCLCLSPCLFV
jgi:hypothetical protein